MHHGERLKCGNENRAVEVPKYVSLSIPCVNICYSFTYPIANVRLSATGAIAVIGS